MSIPSTTDTSTFPESPETVESPAPPKAEHWLISVLGSPAFVPGVLVVLGLTVCFWDLIKRLPGLWTETDGYYSHGFLVPVIIGYMVYRRWPKMRTIPIKPAYWTLALLIPLAFGIRAATMTDIPQIESGLFVAALALGICYVGGLAWAWALAVPTLYTIFMLPIWTALIDNYTGPLQILSTSSAAAILKTLGFAIFQPNPTAIYLDHYQLDIAMPCSGLRLVLAMTAFTVFFIWIANLKPWANAVMVAMILPLCLFINGLRIALIGIVGNAYGHDAGTQFHDYSGYITLVLCFLILRSFARLLGWKD